MAHLQQSVQSGGKCRRLAARLQSHQWRPFGQCIKGYKRSRAKHVLVRAGPVKIDEEDLMQFPDRYKWYEAKFAADDMPDWNPGRFVSSNQEAPHQRLITFTAEISRERVPLRNAYKAAGQKAAVRINGGEERDLMVVSAPPPELVNNYPLFLCKGDIFSGETKTAREPTSVMADIQVLVCREEAPEVYDMGPDDLMSVGPFQGTGMDMRSSGIMAIFRWDCQHHAAAAA
eukprot:GHRR01028168.1.p1 GENE.GHRR01028168.1~~GHRR01028168.1.p1  ORF type:complete len:230 (+),score=54.24 GHRR01028168.1:207-896(+)